MSCPTGKIEHQSRKAAEAHADSLFKKDGHLPNIYICKDCGHLHVGGGRASDRPVHRPVPIVTKSRPVFVQKKIDKGRQVGLEKLVLEKLRTTFLRDKAIATTLNTEAFFVTTLRRQNKILEYRKRRTTAIRALLAANPKRIRKEIAQVLNVNVDAVRGVAHTMGLKQAQLRGVKSPHFGKKQSKFQKRLWAERPELRKQLSEAIKTKQWGDVKESAKRRQWLREYNKSPEVRAMRSEMARKQWAKYRATHTPAPKPPTRAPGAVLAASAGLRATGKALATLAGSPSKSDLIAAFGKKGYALSWEARAAKLGVAPEVLCVRFKNDKAAVKVEWDRMLSK